MVEEAKERGSRITRELQTAGKEIGLEVELEYPVLGGRIDVVWLWKGPEAFPARLPLVGFEIESSWRTRKHLKGDLLNLLELQPALGVIVLCGDGSDVESTRNFAREMVKRRATRIWVWDESDVAGLGSDRSRAEELLAEAGADLVTDAALEGGVRPLHGGKYWRLSEWLASQEHGEVRVTFAELEEVLGLPLPPSSRNHPPHWHSYQGSAVARAIIDAGWRARDVNLTAETVRFERVHADPANEP